MTKTATSLNSKVSGIVAGVFFNVFKSRAFFAYHIYSQQQMHG